MGGIGLEEELSCPVCQDIFRNPVLLSCSHSFCKACLTRWWRSNDARDCPVCKSPSGFKAPTCNLVLKNTCEAFLLERDRQAASQSEPLCSLHSEKLKLFCLEHQQPVCLICRDSEVHKDHSFRPINEVAPEHRKKLQEALTPLQEKLDIYKQVKGKFYQTADHIQAQARHTETQIRMRIHELRWFLLKEEQARMSALRKEVRQKNLMVHETVERLNVQIAALSDIVRFTERQLSFNDASFLQNYDSAVQKIQSQPLQTAPQLGQGALIDEAKHLGNLDFRIWKRMERQVSYTPVILDPNTAGPGIVVSDKMTSVTLRGIKNLIENPERFTFQSIILGSEGFVEGTHSWNVEVGDNTYWYVGVAAETVVRKESISGKPDWWAVWFFEGKYRVMPHQESFSYHPKVKLRVIRVHLDLEGGTLSFSDPATETHVHTFSDTWTERMFPFFSSGNKFPLKILPVVSNNNDGGRENPPDETDEHIPPDDEDDEHITPDDDYETDEHIPPDDEDDEHIPPDDEDDEHIPPDDEDDEHIPPDDYEDDEHMPPDDETDEDVPPDDDYETDEHIPPDDDYETDEHIPTDDEDYEHIPPDDHEDDEHIPPDDEDDEHIPPDDETDEDVPPDDETDEDVRPDDETDEDVRPDDETSDTFSDIHELPVD